MLLQQSLCLCCVIFTAWRVEDPNCSCYPSFLIAFWSDVPGFQDLDYHNAGHTAARDNSLHQAHHYMLHVITFD